VRKSEEGQHKLIVIEEKCPRIPRRGWAEMIRKAYEVDPLVCPECGGRMKIIAFITDYSGLDLTGFDSEETIAYAIAERLKG
jgi:hypothetical protein